MLDQELPIVKTRKEKAPSKRPSVLSLRLLFVAVGSIGGASLGVLFLPKLLDAAAKLVNSPLVYSSYAYIYPAMGLFGFIVGAGLFTFFANQIQRTVDGWEKMKIGDKVNLFLGIFAGIIAGIPFLVIFQSLGAIAPVITLALIMGFSAVSIYALRSINEVLPWNKTPGIAPKRTGIKILDTNVLIDGRFYDIVKTGFLEGTLYVPQFVLLELQHIADASDSLRRQRGRRGLEVLRHLQSEFTVEVGEYDQYAPDDKEPVDARLVRLAKAIGGDLVSNDYNLNRVARIQDVRVLNINDLALSLRPAVLPGEELELALIREGSQYGQAVGYLEDGTMVVVEGGRPYIGESMMVMVSQVIQTERGKMIFAGIDDGTAVRRPRKP